MSEVKRRDIGGFGVPDLPDEMGFGCPKCDDHELVPLRSSSHDIVALQRRSRTRGIVGTIRRIILLSAERPTHEIR